MLTEEFLSYIKLGIVALIPVVASVIFWLLENKTKFAKLNFWTRQVIIGVIFGAIAVLGTEWGIPMNGAQVNARDAAPLCAGLLFGAPAGIIAGAIGGIERWIAVAWGIGTYTRVACSVSTLIAGIYAAMLRLLLFDDKRPDWFIALLTGGVMEIFHLTMVFVTNLDTTAKAATVVKVCTLPLVIANSLSVCIAAMVLSILAQDFKVIIAQKKHDRSIASKVQQNLLICVLIAYLSTTIFVYFLQTGIAENTADTEMKLGISDIVAQVEELSDNSLLETTKQIAAEVTEKNYTELAEKYGAAEITLVSAKGKIAHSTRESLVGNPITYTQNLTEFTCLLHGEKSYIQDYSQLSYDDESSLKYVGVALSSGFVMAGYDQEHFKENLNSTIVTAASNRHVGSTGFFAIIDADGNILNTVEGWDFSTMQQATESDINSIQFDTLFSIKIEKTKYYCMVSTAESYYIMALLPFTEAYELRDTLVYFNSFMETLVFAALFILIYALIKVFIVNNMRKVNTSLEAITAGNLEEKVEVRDSSEFNTLSNGINTTVDAMKNYIAEAAARIDKDLQFAKDIQSSSLPHVYPSRAEFDLHCLMATAKEVGGDFYDFYFTEKNLLHFMIADVSGKGIPAALFMMRAKTELKTLAEMNNPVNDVFTIGSNALCEGNDAGMFVTAFMCVLNLDTGVVEFANAGHNPPVIQHKGEKFEYLKSRAGFVLAGMEGVRYRKQSFVMQPGDTILLYTDGVTEATNAENELYGEDRLLNILNAKEYENMQQLIESTKADVDAFVAEAPQFDDITMVALRYNGPKPFHEISFEHVSIDDIPQISEFLETQLEAIGAPMKVMTHFNLAVDEIYSNIVKFAYGKEGGPATIRIEETDNPHGACVSFIDSGIPFNPVKKENPDVTLSANERAVSGLGIYVVKNIMDDMTYLYSNDQNILKLTKFFPKADE